MNGTVRIRVNVTSATPCLVLHASGMDITHVALLDPHVHGAHVSAGFPSNTACTSCLSRVCPCGGCTHSHMDQTVLGIMPCELRMPQS